MHPQHPHDKVHQAPSHHHVPPAHNTSNYTPVMPAHPAPQPYQSPSQAVVNSPSMQVMIAPSGILPSVPELEPINGVPRGLEPLHGMTALTILRETHEWLHHDPFFMIFDHRYSILNQFGHRIFFVGEQTQVHSPYSFRPFKLHFFDPRGKLILLVERPKSYDLSFWGADISGNNISAILMPQGEFLGQVIQHFGDCCCANGSKFDVVDSGGNLAFKVNGSWTCTGPFAPRATCEIPLYMRVDLSITSPDSSMRIDNFLVKDPHNPDSSPFGMQVYPQIDCSMKAVLLGFMVDIYLTYYDGNIRTGTTHYERNNYGGHGHRQTYYSYSGRKGCTGWEWCCCIIFTFVVLIVMVVPVVVVKGFYKPY